MCSTAPFIALGGHYLGVIDFDVWYLVLAVTGRTTRRRNAYEAVVKVRIQRLLEILEHYMSSVIRSLSIKKL